MKYMTLGNTGIEVSKLAFGTLTISPLQVNLEIKKTIELLQYALGRGITFFDTSEFYQNYEQIRKGLGRHIEEVVICTKTYAYTAEMARASVNKALSELGRKCIDIICLHEQESELTLQGHSEAIAEFVRCKNEGLIRAIGISTHHIAAAKAVLKHPEIDLVMTVTNFQGLGIVDGTMAEMQQVIHQLHEQGKGVYGMKALGGGNLSHEVVKAMTFVRDNPDLHAMAVGFQNKEEIDIAVDFWDYLPFNNELQSQVSQLERSLHVAEWCIGCGLCVERCEHKALSIVNQKALVNKERCLRCGYCSRVCPEFCLKIY